jgi:hypothetical protein
MGEMKNVYKILVQKSEGRRPLRKPRHRWKDIKMDFREDVDWIHVARIGNGGGFLCTW